MTNIALVHATDLTAEELKTRLEDRPELWRELRLLTLDEEDVGTLAEVGGAAALVSGIDETSFDDIDIAFFFGSPSRHENLRQQVPPSTTVVIVGGLDQPDQGQPLVAGVNLDRLDRRQQLVSPHPASIGMAHILSPLLPLRPNSAAASAILPASEFGQAALDELLEQTRDLLSFKTRTEFDLLPGPLAFNLLDAPPAALAAEVTLVLGDEAPALSATAIYGGVFHGLGLSLHVAFDEDPGVAAITEALEASQMIDFAADPHLVGPKDIAGHDQILISDVRRSSAGRYTLWAVLDPLTIGGAYNALAILEALATPITH